MSTEYIRNLEAANELLSDELEKTYKYTHGNYLEPLIHQMIDRLDLLYSKTLIDTSRDTIHQIQEFRTITFNFARQSGITTSFINVLSNRFAKKNQHVEYIRPHRVDLTLPPNVHYFHSPVTPFALRQRPVKAKYNAIIFDLWSNNVTFNQTDKVVISDICTRFPRDIPAKDLLLCLIG